MSTHNIHFMEKNKKTSTLFDKKKSVLSSTGKIFPENICCVPFG